MNRLKELRERYGISQSRLAEIIEVHQSYVSLWENDKVKLNDLKFRGIEQVLYLYRPNPKIGDLFPSLDGRHAYCWNGNFWVDVTKCTHEEMLTMVEDAKNGET